MSLEPLLNAVMNIFTLNYISITHRHCFRIRAVYNWPLLCWSIIFDKKINDMSRLD
jgi:hypothetical protein